MVKKRTGARFLLVYRRNNPLGMLVKHSVIYYWVSELLSEWVSEWVSEAVGRSERLMLETFVVESLNSGQVILSILLIKLKKSFTWSWSIFQPFSTDLLFASRRRLLCRRLVWFKRCCSREGKLTFHPFNLNSSVDCFCKLKSVNLPRVY